MDFPKSVPGVGLIGDKFVNEDPALGRQGSLIPAEWGNAVTEELLAVIEEDGQTPNESMLTQLRDALYGVVSSTKRRLLRIASSADMQDVTCDDAAVTPKKLHASEHPTITGTATLTGTDNKIVMADVVARLGLHKGDVIQIEGAGAQNAKLRTIESLHTNGNEVQVNYEHCGSRGNGSLKLADFTGPVTIKRIAKWNSAATGLGQAPVILPSALRPLGVTQTNTTNRTIEAYYEVSTLNGASIIVDGVTVTVKDHIGSSSGTSSPYVTQFASIRPNETYSFTSYAAPSSYSIVEVR